jgi:hypothetical protein
MRRSVRPPCEALSAGEIKRTPMMEPADIAARIDALRARMEAAAEALDFDEARRLRDEINLLRGGATPAEARSADTTGLERQQPGRMGLGTSRQHVTPPKGWTPPPKPDPMTAGRNRRPRGKAD